MFMGMPLYGLKKEREERRKEERKREYERYEREDERSPMDDHENGEGRGGGWGGPLLDNTSSRSWRR